MADQYTKPCCSSPSNHTLTPTSLSKIPHIPISWYPLHSSISPFPHTLHNPFLNPFNPFHYPFHADIFLSLSQFLSSCPLPFHTPAYHQLLHIYCHTPHTRYIPTFCHSSHSLFKPNFLTTIHHPWIPFPWFPCMWSFSSMYTHHIQCLSLIFHHHTHLGSSYTHHRLLYYTFNIFLSSPGTWSLSLLTNSLASDAIRGDVYQHRRKRMLDSPSRKVQPCMLLLTWRID